MKKKEYVLPILTFLILSMIMSGLFYILERQSVSENKERYRYIAANQANIMKDSVDTAVARVYTFSALIRDNEGQTDFFEDQAESIYQEIVVESGIPLKNVAIAPNGVVAKVYPVTGNKALVGFDFMDDSKPGNEEAIAAYERGEVVVTNPFELVQGGTGMAGRLPVFLGKDEEKSFWGLVTVTLDFEKMIEGFHLKNLTDLGVNYQLHYEDENKKNVVLAESKEIPKDPVSYRFSIQNLEWYLDVAPVNGWQDYVELMVVYTIIIGVSLLIALLLVDKARIRQANYQLERLAHMDALTNCCSRQYVNTVLVNQRNGSWNDPSVKYSLAIVDIDYFKTINDTYGHEVGDRAILAVAQVLLDHCRQMNGDCVIRHGGDEFVVIWNDITKERFLGKLNDMVESVRKIKFKDYPDLKLTISVGGEAYEDSQDALYYELTAKADKKLYKAKENGRNRYEV